VLNPLILNWMFSSSDTFWSKEGCATPEALRQTKVPRFVFHVADGNHLINLQK
jgi:hypothetical protein